MDAAQSKPAVCILEDDPVSREELADATREMGLPVFVTDSPKQAIDQVSAGRCKVMLVSCLLREMDCFDFLDAVLQIDPDANVVIVNGHSTEESAVEAIKRGARDYLRRPLDREHLRRTLAHFTIDIPGLIPPRTAGSANWEPLPLDEVRRLHILRVLEYCGGNRVRAAGLLGIGRTSLYRFLKRQARSKAAPTAA